MFRFARNWKITARSARQSWNRSKKLQLDQQKANYNTYTPGVPIMQQMRHKDRYTAWNQLLQKNIAGTSNQILSTKKILSPKLLAKKKQEVYAKEKRTRTTKNKLYKWEHLI